jgi:hypothetical protein
MKSTQTRFLSIIFALGFVFLPSPSKVTVPVTGLSHPLVFGYVDNLSIDPLQEFSQHVFNGGSYSVTGLFINQETSFPILQQPSGNAAYVSTKSGVVTQFSLASQYGSIGIVAHNYLAGADFFNLNIGQSIVVVYGDGHHITYTVSDVRQYQALSPNSPYSNFVNLDYPEKQLSATDLFYETYGVSDRLVLQTCIANDASDSWGRLFVIAEPVE